MSAGPSRSSGAARGKAASATGNRSRGSPRPPVASAPRRTGRGLDGRCRPRTPRRRRTPWRSRSGSRSSGSLRAEARTARRPESRPAARLPRGTSARRPTQARAGARTRQCGEWRARSGCQGDRRFGVGRFFEQGLLCRENIWCQRRSLPVVFLLLLACAALSKRLLSRELRHCGLPLGARSHPVPASPSRIRTSLGETPYCQRRLPRAIAGTLQV